MWKCSACQNVNKDEYRFCLNCGNPRPATPEEQQKKTAAAEKSKKKKTSAVTVLLLILSLLLIVAIVAIIVNFPGLSRKAAQSGSDPADELPRHSTAAESTDKPEKGGTSIFIIGGDTAPSVSPTPYVPQAEPTPTPLPTPVPTPAPTVDPNADYLIPDSDSRYITEDDLKNLSWEQCCLARNEIFARHGRIFVTKEIAAYFNGKDWYHGTVSGENFSDTVLNAYEKANINTISQYEKTRWGGSYY